MKHKFLIILVLNLFYILSAGIYGQDLFVNMSASEAETLSSNGSLSRSLKNKKSLLININLEEAEGLKKSLAKLNPNYISEVISVKELTKEINLDLLFEKLEAELSGLSNFVSIPYFSQKWNKTFNLYDWIKIDSLNNTSTGFSANVTQSMKPFGEMDVKYILIRTGNKLSFTSENLSSISYNGIKAVKPGKMQWSLSVFVYNNQLVFYGVGAAKAFDMFGVLRSRLEPAFVGRANAFFLYFINNLI